MQTFLPLPSFVETAAALDNDRLGNQCYREAKTIHSILVEQRSGGWANHPAVTMWRGHERDLALYGHALAVEMGRRTKIDGSPKWRPDVVRRWTAFWQLAADDHDTTPPPWLGDPEFHEAHRSNLIRKLPGHYRPLWPSTPDNLPYVWPKP